MKKRNGFVSNSSSSSFILHNWGAFHIFNVTKQDIIDCFTKLLGSDYCKQYHEDVKKQMKEHPSWYKNENGYENIGPFYIYDMTIKEDKKEALKRWGNLLSNFNCDYSIYADGLLHKCTLRDEFEDAIECLEKIYNFTYYANEKCLGYEYKDGKSVPISEDLRKVLQDIRKKSNIMNQFEILKKSDDVKFFCHFDENEMYGANEMQLDSDKYKSDIYTCDRVIEYLFNYLVEIKKIDPNNAEVLKEYPLTEWQKKNYPEKKYDTANGINLSYKDLVSELVAFNGHEG